MATSLTTLIGIVRMRSHMCMSTFHLQLIGDISGRSTVRWPHVIFLFPFQLVSPLKFMTLNEGYTVQYHIYSPIMTCKEQPSTKIGQVMISLYPTGLFCTTASELGLIAVHTRSVLLRFVF